MAIFISIVRLCKALYKDLVDLQIVFIVKSTASPWSYSLLRQ